MNIPEQRIYHEYAKSEVRSFENFIDSLMRHDDIISDAELIRTIKRINNKLLTVTSKWDSKLPKVAPIETKASSSVEVLSDPGSIDQVVGFRKLSRSSTSSFTEIDPKPGCSYSTNATSYDEEKSIMMVFKDINEGLIVGPKGFYVEEVTTGYWNCNACEANNLPLNNLLMHLKGKAHKKKITFKAA